MKKRPHGCLLALIVLGTLGLIVVWRVRTPPTVTSVLPITQLAPEQQEQRRESARTVEKQIEDIASSARRRERKPFEFKATAEQLTALMEQHNVAGKSPLRDVRVGIAPGSLSVQGVTTVKGVDLVVTLSGGVALRDNQLVYQAESLYVGGVSTPSYKDKAERAITEALNRLYDKAPVHLESVILEQDTLTIKGQTN